MRMSGLCKVEMSAFMDVRGPHGGGANHFEPTRTGPIESAGRGTAEASCAGSGSGAAETDRQVRRMLLRIGEHGDGAPAHGLRATPSNRKLAGRLVRTAWARGG